MFNKLAVMYIAVIFLCVGFAHAHDSVYLKQISSNSADKWSSEIFSLIFNTNGRQIEIETYKLLKDTAERMNEENGYKVINEDITGDGASDYLIIMRIPRGPNFLHVVDGKALKLIYSHGWNKTFVEPNMNMKVDYRYKLREIVCEVIYSDAPEEGKYDEYLKWKNAHQITYIWSEKRQKFVKIVYKNYHK